MTLSDAVSLGHRIHYAPVSGGIVVLDEAGEKSACQFLMKDFLSMRELGSIKVIEKLQQGHHIFHGLVLIYGKGE